MYRNEKELEAMLQSLPDNAFVDDEWATYEKRQQAAEYDEEEEEKPQEKPEEKPAVDREGFDAFFASDTTPVHRIRGPGLKEIHMAGRENETPWGEKDEEK